MGGTDAAHSVEEGADTAVWHGDGAPPRLILARFTVSSSKLGRAFVILQPSCSCFLSEPISRTSMAAPFRSPHDSNGAPVVLAPDRSAICIGPREVIVTQTQLRVLS